MPLGRHSTRLASASTSPAHQATSSRSNMPRATNSSASPITLARKCAASTAGSGMNWRRCAVASSVAGVAPETSSTTPLTKVKADSSSGASADAARTSGVDTPRRQDEPTSSSSARASGSRW